MLINRENSALLLVDVQEMLLGGIHESEQLVDNCRWLLEVAKLVDVPVLASEQYPQGVGPTTDTLRNMLPAEDIIAKNHFSCADADDCSARINALKKSEIIICGMEAHVCILQTAIRLKDQGKKVYVVADAISARNPVDTEYAIARMRDEGITIVTREMVGFEWLLRSDAPEFKDFSKKFLR